jgi:hypothetical protein
MSLTRRDFIIASSAMLAAGRVLSAKSDPYGG